MATRVGVIAEVKGLNEFAHTITWTGLLNGDDGAPVQMPGSNIRSIQFTGTFGSGGTIQIEGSNDGVNYVVLTDPQGNNISKTAGALEAITELTLYIRPRVTAGDGATNLSATLLIRRTY